MRKENARKMNNVICAFVLVVYVAGILAMAINSIVNVPDNVLSPSNVKGLYFCVYACLIPIGIAVIGVVHELIDGMLWNA